MPAKKKTIEFPTEAAKVTIVEDRGDGPTDIRLQALADHASRDLARALSHNEVQILEDIERIKAEDPKQGNFKIAIAVSLDLNHDTIDTAVSYSIKSTTKASHALHPEDDTELPGFEGV